MASKIRRLENNQVIRSIADKSMDLARFCYPIGAFRRIGQQNTGRTFSVPEDNA